MTRLSMIATAAACALLALTAAGHGEELTLHGSTTFNREVIEAHKVAIEKRSGHTLRVIPSRTSFGLQALAEGRADMAMMSTPLEEELARLGPDSPLSKMDLRPHEIFSTRFAIGVHANNPVRFATMGQLRQVLSGKIDNWSQLGGRDETIRVTFVGQGGGVTSTVEHVLLNGKEATPAKVFIVRTAVQLAWTVEQHTDTLAFGQLSLLRQRGIPELKTDGKIEQPLILVTKGDPTPAMKAVIEAARAITAQREN